MKFIKFLSKLSLSLDTTSFNARLAYKTNRSIINHMLNMVAIVVRKLSKGWVGLTISMLKRASRIIHTQGFKGYVKYLKTCAVITQQAIGNYKIENLTPLGCRVARSKSGLPSIIPPFYRKRIREGHTDTMKVVLTILNIFRAVTFESTDKIDTIIQPRSVLMAGERRLYKYIPLFKDKFISECNSYDKLSTPDPFPIQTASPNSYFDMRELSTHPNSLIRTWIALGLHPKTYRSMMEFITLLPKSSSLEKAFEVMDFWTQRVTRFVNYRLVAIPNSGDVFTSLAKLAADTKRISHIGKLGLKQEAAGKVRVFAMVDPITQWILNPLHKWIFSILRRKPYIDGTFNQLEPLKRVPFGKGPIFSYDLSAATDRLPVSLQEAILSHVFTPRFAFLWKEILVGRSYYHPDRKESLKYAVGQPMGALSSWGMLALTHHFIVQSSAWIAGYSEKRIFKRYIILGDDIIIWDARVAKTYLSLMKGLGVEVGLAKSLISLDGTALEFAKKTLYKGTDVSPVPIKEYASALRSSSSFIELVRKYSLTIGPIKRLLGLGFASHNSLRMKMFELLLLVPKSHKDVLNFYSSIIIVGAKEMHFHQAVIDLVNAAFRKVNSFESILDKPGLRFIPEENLKTYKWFLKVIKQPGIMVKQSAKSFSDWMWNITYSRWIPRTEKLFGSFFHLMDMVDNSPYRISASPYSIRVLRDTIKRDPQFVESFAKRIYSDWEDLSMLSVQSLLDPSHIPSRAAEKAKLRRIWDKWSVALARQTKPSSETNKPKLNDE